MKTQVVMCENCGTEWRIWGFAKDCEIIAEMVTCPMCDYKVPPKTDFEKLKEKKEHE